MTLNDIKRWLKIHDVSPYDYAIDDLGYGDTDGIGFIDGQWCTYYSERGSYHSVKPYPSEDEACRAFAERIRRVMTIRHGINLPPP